MNFEGENLEGASQGLLATTLLVTLIDVPLGFIEPKFLLVVCQHVKHSNNSCGKILFNGIFIQNNIHLMNILDNSQ